MTRKQTKQSRPGAQSISKKRRPSGGKTSEHPHSPSQTQRPYEQDVKRRIGQFSGKGEPPLMKK